MVFEYLTASPDFSTASNEPLLTRWLNDLGREGWELVGAMPVPVNYQHNVTAYVWVFKRPHPLNNI